MSLIDQILCGEYWKRKVLHNWEEMRIAVKSCKPGDILFVDIWHNKFLLDTYFERENINNINVFVIN